MSSLKVFDLVKVVAADEDIKEFENEVGIIYKVHKESEDMHAVEDQYEIIFIGKKLNEKSKELGGLLWENNQLEAV